jgi:methylase of polypeptide subunit release factors
LDCYRELAAGSWACRGEESWIIVEIGLGQSGEVASIFEGSGWSAVWSIRDLAMIERVLVFR